MNVLRDKERERETERKGGREEDYSGCGDGSVFVVNWLGVFARTCGVIMCIHVYALPNT